MKNLFKRAPRIGRKSYLLTYNVFNIRLSLVRPLATGHYSLTSDGPLDVAPDIAQLTGFVVSEVKNALDMELIAAHNGLSDEAQKPENFTVVITSITPVL